jgi:hypothetical protein
MYFSRHMELAIPVIAFGWLYLISNQRNKPEPFTNGTASSQPQMVQTTQKYNQYKANKETAAFNFKDMAGRTVPVADLSSTNMVPFLGRTKAVGNEFRNQTEQSMDNKTGGGSLQFVKSEVAPLFKPQENIQRPYGSPNSSDFYQSRVNLPMNAHNVKPFQEQLVAPGLNLGFGTEGSGGFNSGMEAREKWTEKTVDELRVLTNPKQTFTYDGHMGPAQNLVKNMGAQGSVEKRLPDKFFVNTPDRYFTEVGAQTAPTYRSHQMNPDVHRVHTPYVGGAGQKGAENPPQKPLVREDHRQQFGKLPLLPAVMPIQQGNAENERKSMSAYANNRTTNAQEHSGNLGALIGAITAPVTDMLRPTRKETVLVPKRLGNATVITGPTPQLLPTAAKVPVTTKETTSYSPFATGMRPYQPSSDGYTVASVPVSTKDDTSVSYVGIAGGMLPKATSNEGMHYVPEDRAAVGRFNGGNMDLFSGKINQTTTSMREHPSSMGVQPSSLFSQPPTIQRNETRSPQAYQQLDRNSPDILDAFRNNPYTQSLSSVA